MRLIELHRDGPFAPSLLHLPVLRRTQREAAPQSYGSGSAGKLADKPSDVAQSDERHMGLVAGVRYFVSENAE